jgi:hypothetical protein
MTLNPTQKIPAMWMTFAQVPLVAKTVQVDIVMTMIAAAGLEMTGVIMELVVIGE